MNKEIDITGRTIKTRRLTLRPFCQDDLDDFYEYAKLGQSDLCHIVQLYKHKNYIVKIH